MTNLRTLKNSELVAMYNAAAEKLGMKPVNKFADKETAIVRTKALMAKIGTEVVDAAVRESTLPPPAAAPEEVIPKAPKVPTELVQKAKSEPPRASTAPKAAARKTTAPKAPKVPRTRRMDFNFKPMSAQKVPEGDSLRAQAFRKLNTENGVKFETIVKLVEKFDTDRGSGNSNTIERRAYELVRLVHYACGYGLEHNEVTGTIRAYA